MPPVLLGIPWAALRGPLQNQFWKKRRPQPYSGGDNSGNALEASNALNYRIWGIPAVLSRGIPGNALRAFPGSFRNFSGFLPESPSRTGGMAYFLQHPTYKTWPGKISHDLLKTLKNPKEFSLITMKINGPTDHAVFVANSVPKRRRDTAKLPNKICE